MKYNENTKKSILISFVKTNSKLLGLTFFSGVLSNVLTILIPVSIGKYYDLLFEFHSKRAVILNFFPKNWTDTLPHFLTFFVIIVLLRIALNFIQRNSTSKLGELFVKKIREDLFSHQLKIEQSIYDEKGTGKYLLRFSGDLNSIKGYLTVGIIRFSIDFFLLLLTFIVMYWLNPTISSVLLIGIAITVVFVYFLNKHLYEVSNKLRNTKSGLLSYVNRSLLAISTIKVFNKYSIEQKKFNRRSNKVYKLALKYQRVNNFIIALIPGLLYLTLGGVLYFIYLIKIHQSTVSFSGNELLAFVLLFITILPVIRRTLRVSTKWKVGGLSFDKLVKVFNFPVEKGLNNEELVVVKKGEINFDKVSYVSKSNEKHFTNLSFNLRAKKCYLITHENKEWRKEVLLKLMIGIYETTSGSIYFDGQNYNKINSKDLRRNIAVVSSHLPIVGRNVLESIVYNVNDLRKERAIGILESLQKGMNSKEKLSVDTVINENASNLSLQQRTIVYYARAFSSNKKIIIINGLSQAFYFKFYPELLNYLIALKKKGSKIIILDRLIDNNLIDEIIKI